MPVPAVQPAATKFRSPPRLRPGERPAWWDAGRDRWAFASWRAEARAAGMGLDAWVGVLLEFELVIEDLADLPDPLATLRRAVAAEHDQARLGPASPLRDWAATDFATYMPQQDDELPELLLAERLTARLMPGASLAPRLHPNHLALARACDRRAAAHGRTLESWALRVALRAC